MRRLREATVTRPSETDSRDGLAYTLWRPDAGVPVRGGVVILHGAGSVKESHYDFARLVRTAGFAALAFDARGHGESTGPMDGRALQDIVGMGELLRARLEDPAAPLFLRGSSMGGYFAILAAGPLAARGVVAICPASAEGLRRGLHAGRFGFPADVPALDALLAAHELPPAVAALAAPLLLLHAEGDEQVPIAHSRELAGLVRHPASRLIALPGGHHRSIQHDGEMQAISLRFLQQALVSR